MYNGDQKFTHKQQLRIESFLKEIEVSKHFNEIKEFQLFRDKLFNFYCCYYQGGNQSGILHYKIDENGVLIDLKELYFKTDDSYNRLFVMFERLIEIKREDLSQYFIPTLTNQPNFTKWISWSKFLNLNDENLKYPGIYCLTIGENCDNKDFDWDDKPIYIGMTNSKSGLKGRLKQFDDSINFKPGHGGGERVRFDHDDYNKLRTKLFVSVCAFKIENPENIVESLKIKGKVAEFEYLCFAKHYELYGYLPIYNQPTSPKLKQRREETTSQTTK